MIADAENPAEAVYLDGRPLDLTLVTMADDERGLVEQLVTEHDERGRRRIKCDRLGMAMTVELRGEVRIVMPGRPCRLH